MEIYKKILLRQDELQLFEFISDNCNKYWSDIDKNEIHSYQEDIIIPKCVKTPLITENHVWIRNEIHIVSYILDRISYINQKNSYIYSVIESCYKKVYNTFLYFYDKKENRKIKLNKVLNDSSKESK